MGIYCSKTGGEASLRVFFVFLLAFGGGGGGAGLAWSGLRGVFLADLLFGVALTLLLLFFVGYRRVFDVFSLLRLP
jgi:hypothetical protein